MTKHKKSKPTKSILLVLLGLIGFSALMAALLRGNDIILFNPRGYIADEQNRLLVASVAIMLIFAVPVLTMLYFFAWKYRETNDKATYDARSHARKPSALLVWAIPIAVMLALASLMVPATFRLEPQNRIQSQNDTMTIQVVALRWKWLFIYPEHGIATINHVQLPVNTPVEFVMTADEAPFSALWIPHLGGMMHVMTEHVNRLNLIADTTGDYEGSSTEINGHGFAGMRFNTRVSSTEDFNQWVQDTKSATNELNSTEYASLLKPSEYHGVTLYKNADPELYSSILSKYAGSHGGSHNHEKATEHGSH